MRRIPTHGKLCRGVSHLGRVLTIEYPTLRQYKRDSFIRHQAAPVYKTRCASREIAGRAYLEGGLTLTKLHLLGYQCYP